MNPHEFLKMLRIKHGIEAYWIDKSIIMMYGRDYWPLMVYGVSLGRGMAIPKGVAIPKNEGEVVKILNLASKYEVPVRVYGGGSGVLGGATPGDDEVILDLTKLNWIRWHDRRSRIIDVGSGTYMGEIERWLDNQGYTSRHYPQSIDVATIGGLISTLSSGQYSTGYGNIEDMVLGLHYVSPAIGLVKIKPNPRRSILPLLNSLVLGGEGSFGVVTRVYLGVYKKPKKVIKFAYITKDFGDSINRVYRIIEAGIYPQLLRVLDEYESMVTLGIREWGSVVLGVLEGGMASRQNIKYIDRVLGNKLGEEVFDRWYSNRNKVIKYIYTMYRSGLGIETIELASPWSRILEVYNEVRSRVLEIDGVTTATAHIGHFYNNGVGIYFTFAIDLNKFSEAYRLLWETVEYIALKYDCSPLHHHGIGRIRGKYVKEYIGVEGANLLRLIKKTLDPNNVLRGGLSQLLQ